MLYVSSNGGYDDFTTRHRTVHFEAFAAINVVPGMSFADIYGVDNRLHYIHSLVEFSDESWNRLQPALCARTYQKDEL